MNLHKWLLPVALIVGSALAGCKKDEKESEYLTGELSLSLPAYVSPGYTKTFRIDTLMSVSRSDGGPIGYRFLDAVTGKADTLVTADGVIRQHEYTFSVPDTLATLIFTLNAFVDADAPYYSSTATATFIVVKPGWTGDVSITNFDARPITTEPDPRDGKVYHTVKAGDRVWMRNNLAWEGAGAAYLRCPAMTDIFGRYYTWEEAQTACPEGWHLPSDAEWTRLAEDAEAGMDIPELAGKVMGDLYFNGVKMWEYWPGVPVSDALRLSVMPVGYATVGDGEYSFDGIFTYAAFWTADETEDGYGVCRYIYHDKNIVYRGQMPKAGFAASVRCVRES